MVGSMQMQIPHGIEWIVIAVVVIALFFGAKKIPEFARSIARATTEYEKAKIEAKRELQNMSSSSDKQSETLPPSSRKKLEHVANSLGINYEGKTDDELRLAISGELAKVNRS